MTRRVVLKSFTDWVDTTPLSLELKALGWLVPASQSLHILAVGVVLAAFLMLTMRTAGLTARGVGISLVTARFLPWVWAAIGVLALTGILQMIAEPGRALPNPFFQAKMVFLAIVVVLLARFQRSVRRDPAMWDGLSVFPRRVRAVFIVIVALTVLIVFCGRWIAYSTVAE